MGDWDVVGTEPFKPGGGDADPWAIVGTEPRDAHPDMGQVEKGARAGFEGLKGSLSAFKGLAGAAIGSPEMKQAGLDAWKEYSEKAQEYSGRTPNLTDIKDFSSFTDWLGYTAGSVAPSIAATLVGTLGGAAAGTAIAGPVGTLVGGIGGGIASAYPMNTGEVYGALMEKGEDRPGLAALAGVPITALDVGTGPVGRGLRKIAGLGAKEAIEQGGEGFLKKVAKEAPKSAAEEMLGEGAQEAIKAGTVSYATDQPFATRQTALDVINAMGAGLVGGVIGSPIAAAMPNRRAAPPPGASPDTPSPPSPGTTPPAGDQTREALVAPPTPEGYTPVADSFGVVQGFTRVVDGKQEYIDADEVATSQDAPGAAAPGAATDVAGQPPAPTPAPAVEPGPMTSMPAFDQESVRLLGQQSALQQRVDQLRELHAGIEVTPATKEAQRTLADLRAIEQLLQNPDLDPTQRKQLATQRDQLLTNTNPETLQDAAVGLEMQTQVATEMGNAERQLQQVNAALAERQQQSGETAALSPVPKAPAAPEVAVPTAPTETPIAETTAPETEVDAAPLRTELDRLGLPDVALKLEAQIRDGTANGQYLNRLISIAADNADGLGGMQITLHHEAVHAMRDLGLFTPAEWQTLTNHPAVKARLPQLAAMYKKENIDVTPESLVEEAIADQLAEHKTRPAGALGRVWQAVSDRLKALGRALRGGGIRNYEDLARAFKSGEVGKRPRTKAPSGEAKDQIAAYHGSPHDHDKFDSSKIGTGEGAQAYGWGLYFAGKKAVAEHYRKALSDHVKTAQVIAEKYGLDLDEDDASSLRSLAHLDRDDKYRAQNLDYRMAQARALSEADRIKLLNEVRDTEPGKLYTVDLAPDEHELLDWDKSLAEQSDAVKAALRESDVVKDWAAASRFGYDVSGFRKQPADRQADMRRRSADGVSKMLDRLGKSGGRFYDTLAEQLSRDENGKRALSTREARREASLALAEAGIPGIRYFDGSSRGKGEGTSNYVIFDDKHVEIKAKFKLRGAKASENELIEHLRKGIEGRMTADLQTLQASRAKAKLYKVLRGLTEEGAAGRYWYERSGKAVLDYAQGDTEVADKIAQLIAIYSPRNSVAGNTSMAIRAWNRYLAGKPINDPNDRIGTEPRDRAAAELLENGRPFEGRKVNNFYLNLTRHWSEGEQGVTADVWMARAFGFVDNEAGQANKYELIERITKKIAKDMGWEPQQVQAAIWVATKTRYEQVKGDTIKEAVAKGWMIETPTKRGKPELTIVDHDKTASLWRKNALGSTVDPDNLAASIRDFSHFIADNLAQVSVEMIPGKTTEHLTGLHGLAPEIRAEYFQRASQAMLDERGRDEIMLASGLLSVDGFSAPGYWQGLSDVSSQTHVVINRRKFDKETGGTAAEKEARKLAEREIDPAQKELLTATAAAYGIAQMQEGVGFHLAKPSKTKMRANAVEVDIGRRLTADEIVSFGKALEAANPAMREGASLVSIPRGVRVLSFEAIPNVEMHRLVETAAAAAIDADIKIGYLGTDGALIENNWKQSPYGQDYLAQVVGPRRPGLLRATSAVLARLEQVDREFADRYGLPFRDDLYAGIRAELARAADGRAKLSLRFPAEAEVPLASPVPVDRLDAGPETQREIYGRFGGLTPGSDSTDRLKIYDLSKLTAEPAVADGLLDRYGYRVKYFAYHDAPDAGVEFRLPKLKKDGYGAGTLWIYDPRVADASFKDVAYTNAWRIMHELGHAISEGFLDAKYGASKREGRLGRESESTRGMPPKQVTIEMPALSLEQVQRAVEWEDVAFRAQRMLLEEAGATIDDVAFAHEYNINLGDAVYRTLTGEFGNPGEYGFMPADARADLRGVLQLLERAEAEMAKQDGRAPTKGVDLKGWEPVSDAGIRSALKRAAVNPRAGNSAESDSIARQTDATALAEIKAETGDTITPEQLNKARGPLYALRQASVKGSAAQEAIMDRTLQFASDVPFGQRLREGWTELRANGFAKFKQGMLDRLASIAELERGQNAGKLMDAAVSAYKAMRMTTNLSSVMHVLLKKGMIDYRGGEFVGTGTFKGGFEAIFEPLAKKGTLRLFQAWAVANRANRLIKEGREKLMDQADIDELLKLGVTHPEFAGVLAQYQGFNAQILNLAEKTGLLDPVTRAALRSNDYVPFYRVLDQDGKVGGPGTKGGVSGQTSGVLRLRGGDAMINDLFDNMTRNMSRMVDASFKNVAATRTIDLLLKTGGAVKRGPDFKAAHFTATQLQDTLDDVGIGSDVIKNKDLIVKLFTMVQPQDADVVSIKRAGKTEYYTITDPLLLMTFGPSNVQQNAIVEMGGKFSNVLRRGITSMPDFMIANFIRDTMSAWVVSGGKTNPFKAVGGFLSALRDSVEAQEIAAAGGGGKGFYGTKPADVAKQLNDQMAASPRGILRKAWDVWEKIGQASEQANRIAVYKTLKKAGATNAEAAYQALDLLDFGMRGDFAAMRAVTTMVPFMNARIQGLYKLTRAAKENPVGFWLRGTAIMVPSIALAMMNIGQDWYDEITDDQRERYYHFKIGGQHLRIPKGFEVGAIFSTAPELLVHAWYGTEYGHKTVKRAAAILLDQFNFNPTPQAIKPLLDQVMNKQGIIGGFPIVPHHYQDLPNAQQFSARTSEIAKTFGGVTGASPLRVDALMQGYFGSFGALIAAATDGVAHALSSTPTPSKRIEDMPIIGRYARGEPALSTTYASSWYEIADSVKQIARGVKAYQEVGDTDAAERLLNDNPAAKGLARHAVAVNKQLATIAKQERRVQADREISSADKRTQLDELVSRRNEIQRRAVEQARERLQ